MIIRSQDKRGIVNLNNIDTICIEPNYCGYYVAGYNGTQESCVKLGEYPTEAKAIKVLDMICADIMLECLIFQMPADEDVEV